MATRVDEKRAKALKLHLAGASYDSIAQQVGYASRSGAYKAVQEALAKALPADAEKSSPEKTELARLDAMLQGLWPAASDGDVQAVDRVLKIEERRRQLQVALKVTATESAPDQKATPLDELKDRRARRATGAPASRSTTRRKV